MAVAGGRCPGPGQRGRRRRRRLSRAAAMIPPPQPRCQSSRCAWSSAGQRTGPGCERRSGRGWRGSEGAGGRARKAFSPASPLFFPFPSLRLFGRLGEGPCRREAGGAGSEARGSEGRRSGTGRSRAACRAARGGRAAGSREGDRPGSLAAAGGWTGAGAWVRERLPVFFTRPSGGPLEEVVVPGPRGPCGRRAAARRSQGSPSQISHVGTCPEGLATRAKGT